MGGKSTSDQTQTQSSTTNPWQPAQGLLTSILGGLNGQVNNTGLNSTQSNALDNITNNAQFYSGAFTPQVSNVTSNMLNGGDALAYSPMVKDAYSNYLTQTTPLASNTNYDPYQTPGFSDAIKTMTSDITNNVNGSYAAAGRDGSPANAMALGRGIAQGVAPTIASQYNQNVNNQQGAARDLYGAGNATGGMLSQLLSQRNTNQAQGVGMVPNVVGTANSGSQTALEAELQRLGIPLQNLGMLSQIGIPIAGLGSQSSGTGTGHTENQMSGAQQFGTIAQGIGALMPKAPMSFSF